MVEQKIFEIDIWNDLSMGYMLSIRNGEDELGLIIKGHLLIEYALNQLIQLNVKNPNVFFKDNRLNAFSTKLNLIDSLGLLPRFIIQNISTINKIRNHYAHNLNVSTLKLTFLFYREKEVINFSNKLKKKKYPVREYIKFLIFGTFNDLNKAFTNKYKRKVNFSIDVFLKNLD